MACGAEGDGPATPHVPAAGVALAPSTIVLAIGEARRLTATPLAAKGQPLLDRAVTWTSSTPEVATVLADGTVRASGAGDAMITATSEGKSAMAALTVPTPALRDEVSSLRREPAPLLKRWLRRVTLRHT